MLSTPTPEGFRYQTTAYTYDQVCAAIVDLEAAYNAFLPVCVRFNNMFTGRYFSHIGPHFITDKEKIDDDYILLSKLRQSTFDIDEPPMGNGFGGASRSGGSQEAYPVKKWTDLARRYKSLTRRLLARGGA